MDLLRECAAVYLQRFLAMRKLTFPLIAFLACSVSRVFAGVVNPPVIPGQYAPGVQTTAVQAQMYKTTADLTTTLGQTSPNANAQPLPTPIAFQALAGAEGPSDITVDPSRTFQTWEGCGASMTDASANVIQYDMSANQRLALLQALYGPTLGNFQFCRIAWGTQDFRANVAQYSFDDLPSGQTDTNMVNFSVLQDTKYIIPALQQMMVVNPATKVIGTAWTAPQWMLSSGTFGNHPVTFDNTKMQAWANYYLKSIQAYEGYGIPIWAMSPANEPSISPYWMGFTNGVTDEINFVGNYLGPTLSTNGLSTKILGFDDSMDSTYAWPDTLLSSGIAITATGGSTTTITSASSAIVGQPVTGLTGVDAGQRTYVTTVAGSGPYTLTVSPALSSSPSNGDVFLLSSSAQPYISGIAWHAYAGAPATSMARIQSKYPGTNQYMTEWRSMKSTASVFYAEPTGTDVAGMAGLLISCARSGCKGFILWNMALDQNTGPENGVDTAAVSGRRAVVEVNNGTGVVTYNPEYWVENHLSRFLKPGAVRIASSYHGIYYKAYQNYPSDVISAAFQNPDGTIVCFVYNGKNVSVNYTGSTCTFGASTTFNVIDARSGQAFPVTLGAGDMATFVWGTSAQSSPASTPPTLTVPSTPTLAATGAAGQVNLSWSAPTSTYPVNYYNILRSTTTGTETQLVQVPSTPTTYSDLQGGLEGAYYYKLSAVSAGGTSALSTEQTATSTSATAPSPPTGVAVTGSAGATRVAWSLATPNGYTATVYHVLRSTTSGAETNLATLNQGTTAYTDTTTGTGMTYYYEVTAVNTVGTSAVSSEVSFFQAASVSPLLDAVGGGYQASGSATDTFSFTTGAGLTNSIILIYVGYSKNGSTVNTITYGGVSCTKLFTADAAPGDPTDRTTDGWYLKSPPAGAANVVVTLNNTSSAMNVLCATYQNVNQTTPFRTNVADTGTAGTSSSATTTSGTALDIVLSGIHIRTSSTPSATGTSQSVLTSHAVTTDTMYLSAQPGGTGSIVSSWTWTGADHYAADAVALVPG